MGIFKDEWISVKERLPETGIDVLVYGPRGHGSMGGPYVAVAMLNLSGTWGILRMFEARDQLGVLMACGHRRVDVSVEWHGVHVTHWMRIAPLPPEVRGE